VRIKVGPGRAKAEHDDAAAAARRLGVPLREVSARAEAAWAAQASADSEAAAQLEAAALVVDPSTRNEDKI
jgi:hypothetical protein